MASRIIFEGLGAKLGAFGSAAGLAMNTCKVEIQQTPDGETKWNFGLAYKGVGFSRSTNPVGNRQTQTTVERSTSAVAASTSNAPPTKLPIEEPPSPSTTETIRALNRRPTWRPDAEIWPRRQLSSRIAQPVSIQPLPSSRSWNTQGTGTGTSVLGIGATNSRDATSSEDRWKKGVSLALAVQALRRQGEQHTHRTDRHSLSAHHSRRTSPATSHSRHSSRSS